MRLMTVLLVGLLAGCGASTHTDVPDGGGGGDGSSDATAVVCDPPCAADQICHAGQCIPAVPCSSDDDCQADTYCLSGYCVPYGPPPRSSLNPVCTRVVPAGLLTPQIACEWLAPAAGDPFPNHKQVLTTPVVVDFNFDGHVNPDNPTTKPSIVITTYDGLDGASGLGPLGDGANYGIIRVLDGRTCTQQHVISTHVVGSVTLAVGDLDGDRRAEIVAMSAAGGLVAFRYDEATAQFVTLWTSHDASNASVNPLAGLGEWTGVTLADLDDDGRPEALLEGWVFDSTGLLVDGTAGDLNAAGAHGVGQFPVIADVDRDGVPELVSAHRLLRWVVAQRHWEVVHTYPYDAGYVAVADFGKVTGATLDRTTLDGVAEIAVVASGQAWIMALDGTTLFGPIALPGSTGGGPPTIGDFDHDGRPELAAAGSDSYNVFDPDCTVGGTVDHCPTLTTNGILWSSQSQDHSSNITGSSLFDFEGDGNAEAVYADECYARIYDGRSGEVLFSQPRSSCTWNENPIVADAAGNFRSKLIVPSNENCSITCPAIDPVFNGLRCQAAADCPNGIACDVGFCRCTADADCNTTAMGGGFVCRPPTAGTGGNTCQASNTGRRTGVRVFGDVLDRWVASRPLWNQHAYSVTNVDDYGTIPRTSATKRNWEQPGLNNFRMNVQGELAPELAPDATSQANITASCSASGVVLQTTVCNRGTAPIGDGMPVTFYQGAVVMCTAHTTIALGPGDCAGVTCTSAAGTTATSLTITVVADDDGTGHGGASECYEKNNTATATVACGPG